MAPNDKYDLILVGTGFASTFFLYEYLKLASQSARILILERGRKNTHKWQVNNRRNSEVNSFAEYDGRMSKKRWLFNVGFGGGSNCWWASVPRMTPDDFTMKTKYGVGHDWPLNYGDLEQSYYEAELIMSVSGSSDSSPYPRAVPYPQAPHTLSGPDEVLKKAYPDRYFPQPAARTRTATDNRPPCCANGVCNLCPIDSKFTILNEMNHLYEDTRVTLMLGAAAESIEVASDVATGVTYLSDNTVHTATGEFIALGANAIFNPFILLRSGILHPLLGKRLSAQVSLPVVINLDGVDNFQGSTSLTGLGYMLYDTAKRAEYAGCLIESVNTPQSTGVRAEKGKWRQRVILNFIYEDIPSEKNRVEIDPDRQALPKITYLGHSAYTQKAIEKLPDLLPTLLAPLPIETLTVAEEPDTVEPHIIGTVVMGNDERTSIVDKNLVHHKIRNLAVLGSSAFPTTTPANPTLTLSALSIKSARYLFG